MFTIYQTAEFESWIDALDKPVQARVAARLSRAEMGNLGDHKPVGAGVSEMRMDFGPGYRLYFAQRGNLIIVMLGGGIKRTQKKDVAKAHKLAATLGAL